MRKHPGPVRNRRSGRNQGLKSNRMCRRSDVARKHNSMPESSLPELLRAYRARHGWSQAQAARVCGVPKPTWQNWEIGRPMTHGALVSRLLAELLG